MTGCVSTCWLQNGETQRQGHTQIGAALSESFYPPWPWDPNASDGGGSLSLLADYGITDWLEVGGSVGAFIPPLVSGGVQVRAGILAERRGAPVSLAIGAALSYGEYEKQLDPDDFVFVEDWTHPGLTVSRDLGTVASVFGTLSCVRRRAKDEGPSPYRILLGHGGGAILWLYSHWGEERTGRLGLVAEYEGRADGRLRLIETQFALGLILRE